MDKLFAPDTYWTVLWSMVALAVVVFVALQWIEAPYGVAYRKGWGPSLNNRIGWVVMEAPAFIAMVALIVMSPAVTLWPVAMAALFLIHYFRRSFIFPLLMRGNSRMPWLIALMGATFNTVNVYLIGGWLFYICPIDYYAPLTAFFSGDFTMALSSPLPIAFIVGVFVFFGGMLTNWQADYIVRHLRRPGETGHKIPRGGMFRYVTSASYFGEIVEWTGFALLTWSPAGLVFVLWTMANLVPRSAKLHARYLREFGDEYRALNRRRVFPGIY
jgi:3-oxo-5-alpha-steroid 4-dehydrogenase 1